MMTGGIGRLRWLWRELCVSLLGWLAAGCTDGTQRRPSTDVVINELLVSNEFTNFDENRQSSDWVEIYNVGKRAVDLEGYSLSDDVHRARKWIFPRVVLAPGDYSLVWCTGKERPGSTNLLSETKGDPSSFHANFRLRAKEVLLLAAPEGKIVDAVLIPPQTSDRSYGRSPDGTGDFLYQLRPSPGEENRSPAFAAPIPSRLEFDPPGGEFREPITVRITLASLAGVSIRYTKNGSRPTTDSRLYETPLTLRPGGEAGTVVRAAGFQEGEAITPVETHSYFFSVDSFELPILSVAMNPFDFRQVHLEREARGRAGEREGHVEVFAPNGSRVAASGMGLRLHGGMGRSGGFSVKKSYRIHFRDEYGVGKLSYPLIPGSELEAFDTLVLRALFSDGLRRRAGGSFIRDSLVRSLHEQMGAPAVRGTWYNLFVNMRYRGLFNVVERIDPSFLTSRSPQWGEDWDVIKEGQAMDGDLTAWQELLSFVSDYELGDDAHYERAIEMMDEVAFARYMILNLWAQNHDWPHVNYYASRPRRPNGKWRFLVWDAEAGVGRWPVGFEANTLKHVYRLKNAPVARLFVRLMRNPRFQTLVLEEAERQLEGTLLPENVRNSIRRLHDGIAPDVLEDLQRNFPDIKDTAVWEAAIRDLETFADRRPAVLRDILLQSPRFTASHESSP